MSSKYKVPYEYTSTLIVDRVGVLHVLDYSDLARNEPIIGGYLKSETVCGLPLDFTEQQVQAWQLVRGGFTNDVCSECVRMARREAETPQYWGDARCGLVHALEQMVETRNAANTRQALVETKRAEGKAEIIPPMLLELEDEFGIDEYFVFDGDAPVRHRTPGEQCIKGAPDLPERTNRVRTSSPLGMALVGKFVGDEVSVTAPAGETVFRIISARSAAELSLVCTD